jgi:hypothetical protein
LLFADGHVGQFNDSSLMVTVQGPIASTWVLLPSVLPDPAQPDSGGSPSPAGSGKPESEGGKPDPKSPRPPSNARSGLRQSPPAQSRSLESPAAPKPAPKETRVQGRASVPVVEQAVVPAPTVEQPFVKAVHRGFKWFYLLLLLLVAYLLYREHRKRQLTRKKRLASNRYY